MRRAFFFLSVLITALILTMSWKQAPLAASSTERAEVETEPFVSFRQVDHLGGEIRGVAREGNQLYLGRGTRLVAMDVSSPNHVRPGSSPIDLGGIVQSVAVHDGHVYAALGSNGLAIVSSNVQGQLQLLKNVTELEPYDVIVDGSRLYVRQSEEVNIFDLSEPSNPQELGSYAPLYGTGFSVIEDLIITVQLGRDLVIIDATDPSAPSQVSSTQVGSVEALSVANNHAYVATNDDQLQIVDISDPSSPSIVGVLDLPWYASDIVAMGQHAYLDMGQLYVVDVSDPAQPSAVGNLSTARHGKLDVGRLFPAGEDLIVTDPSGGGFHLLDRSSNPSWPSESGVRYEPARVYDSVMDDGKLYLATGNGGVQVIEISDPENLQPWTHFRSPNWTPVPNSNFHISPGVTEGIATGAGYAYVANRLGGLHIVDVRSLEDVEVVSAFSHPPSQRNDMRDVVVRGGIAYIADGNNGLLVLDVSDPEAPEELAALDATPSESSEATQVALVGSYLLLNKRQDGLDLYSLANPRQPTLADQWNNPITAIAARNPYVFLGTADGLRILRVASDGQLQNVGSYGGNFVDGLYVAGDELYLSSMYDGFRVLDISDPASPVVRGSYAGATGNIYGAGEEFVYVAEHGLSALRRLTGVRGLIDDGGILAVVDEGISYNFGSSAFSTPAEIRHTQLDGIGLPLPSATVPLLGPFELEALASGSPVQPSEPFTITIDLPAPLAEPSDADLTLYSFSGEQWTSMVEAELDENRRTVTAVVEQTGTFLLATDSSSQLFLPGVAREAMGGVDLSITGIEVTQASQKLDNSVPLTANRPTVARVYTQVTGNEPIDGVALTLRATRNGNPLPGAVSAGPRAVFPRTERHTPFTSFDIHLANGWLQGNVTLTAEIDVQHVSEVNEQNNTRSVTVTFTPLEPLRVVVVPVNYTYTANGVFCPAPPTEDLYSDGLLRRFPVHNVELSFHAPIDFAGDLGNGNLPLLEHITAVKAADDAPDAVVYYGIFRVRNSNGDNCRGGAAGTGWLGQRVAVGTHIDSSNTRDQLSHRDGAGNLATHEIGHNFGLLHAPCGSPDHIDPDYPYPNASIGVTGYDVSRDRIWSVGHPDYTRDIMSYCLQAWFSDYNYTRLFQDQLANGHIQVAPATSKLLIRASVSKGSAELHPTYVLTRTTATKTTESDAVVVELVDDAGAVLVSQPVAAYQAADDPDFLSVFASVPLPDEPVTMVRLLQDGDVVATRRLSVEKPNQAEVSPALTETDDGGVLRWSRAQTPVLVRYSTDQGDTWTTLAVDAIGGELRLDSRQLPDEPAVFEIRPADSITLDAWTVPFMPSPETGDE